jgi:hypothetical protein
MYGTERGLAARSEIRAEINELITQLEAKNPTPSPTDVSRHGHTAKAPLWCTRLQLAIVICSRSGTAQQGVKTPIQVDE